MERVLITGSSGFIGTNLVDHYRARGAIVAGVDIAAPRAPEHVDCWSKVDILDASALRDLVADFNPTLAFHMAARTDLGGKEVTDYSANTLGVQNLLDALRSSATNLRLAVMASSMLVCRIGYVPADEADYCPTTAYGQSKAIGERLVRQEAGDRIPWVMVRPTSIWGPWFRAPYRDFFTAVQRGLYVHPRNRVVKRSYGFVLNSVHQLASLATAGGGNLLGRTVYLADEEPLDLRHWAQVIQGELGARPVREAPEWVFRVAARFGDVLKSIGYANPPMSTFRLTNMLTDMIHDTAPLHRIAGADPFRVDEAVRITCDWLRRRGS